MIRDPFLVPARYLDRIIGICKCQTELDLLVTETHQEQETPVSSSCNL
jgi:hypothetical protein